MGTGKALSCMALELRKGDEMKIVYATLLVLWMLCAVVLFSPFIVVQLLNDYIVAPISEISSTPIIRVRTYLIRKIKESGKEAK